ncbi:MAG TPA: PorV/PorQ family protein [Longimicrobiales bacterium]|nr:PorV/PorQ family protein [Longimicrobiales bacterium]
MRHRTVLSAALGAASLCTLLGSREARAQAGSTQENVDNIGYGTRAAEFLLLPVGARATALGSAYSALADDPSALYWNPAGVALAKQRGASVSRLEYLAKTSYTWGGLIVPLGLGTWVVGAQFGGFSFGEQQIYTVDQPEGTGSFYSNSMFMGGATLAMNVTDRFSFGGTAKYVQETFFNTSGGTVAFDIGSNYHTTVAGRPFRAAFSLLNLGGNIRLSGSALGLRVDNNDPSFPDREDPAELKTQSFALPVEFKVGVGWQALASPTNSLWLNGEFWQPQQNSTSTAVGAEYSLHPSGASGLSLALRGGYAYEPDRAYTAPGGADLGDKSSDGLSFGGGLGFRPREKGLGLNIDYAYRSMGLLGGTNLFSVNVSW